MSELLSRNDEARILSSFSQAIFAASLGHSVCWTVYETANEAHRDVCWEMECNDELLSRLPVKASKDGFLLKIGEGQIRWFAKWMLNHDAWQGCTFDFFAFSAWQRLELRSRVFASALTAQRAGLIQSFEGYEISSPERDPSPSDGRAV